MVKARLLTDIQEIRHPAESQMSEKENPTINGEAYVTLSQGQCQFAAVVQVLPVLGNNVYSHCNYRKILLVCSFACLGTNSGNDSRGFGPSVEQLAEGTSLRLAINCSVRA